MLSFEADGSVLDYAGNYSEFHDWKADRPETGAKRRESETGATERATGSLDGKTTDEKINAEPLSKNQIRRIEKRITELESALIPKAEKDVAKLQAGLSEAAVLADQEKLRELSEELSSTESRVKGFYEEWEELLEQLT